jgi:hypothetical protein
VPLVQATTEHLPRHAQGNSFRAAFRLMHASINPGMPLRVAAHEEAAMFPRLKYRRLLPPVLFGIAFILLVEGIAGLGLMMLGYEAYHSLGSDPVASLDKNPLRSEKHAWGVWGVPGSVSRHTSSCFDVEYRFNSYGARDVERTERAPLGGTRWIVLGNSFVEGFGISESERITNRLEERLGKEFLNFGMSGHFGPLQYLILYRELAMKFEHAGLIVGFLPHNDFIDNNAAYWAKNYGGAHNRRYRPYLVSNANTGGRSIIYGVDGDGIPREDFDVAPPVPSETGPGKDSRCVTCVSELVRTLSRYSTTVSLARYVKRAVLQAREATQKTGYFVDDIGLIEDAKWVMGELAVAAGDRKRIVLVLPLATDIHRRAASRNFYSKAFASFLGDLRRLGWTVVDTAEAFEPLPRGEDMTLGCDAHLNSRSNQRIVDFLVSRHGDKF